MKKHYRSRRTPVVLQASQTECGAAVLSSILGYYGASIGLDQLRDKCGIARDGCSISTLLDVAEEYGLLAEAYKMLAADLIKLAQPVVLFWNKSHFVVLNYIKRNKVYINDPGHGEYVISLDDLEKSFCGIVVAFAPSDTFKKTKVPFAGIEIIRYWMRQNKNELFSSFLFLLCGFISSLGLLVSIRLFTDGYVHMEQSSWLKPCMLIAVLSITVQVASYVVGKLNDVVYLSGVCIRDARDVFVKSIMLPIVFYAVRKKSDLVALYSRSEYIVTSIHTNLSMLIANSIMVLIFIAVTFILDKVVAVIIVMSLLGYCIVNLYYSKSNRKHVNSSSHISGHLMSHVMMIARNIESIYASGLQTKAFLKWKKLYGVKLSHQANEDMVSCRKDAVLYIFPLVSMSILSVILLVRIKQEHISLGKAMVAYVTYLYIMNYLSSASQSLTQLSHDVIPYGRYKEVASMSVDTRFTTSRELTEKRLELDYCTDRSIMVDNVSFRYTKYSENIIKDITFDARAGQHIGIVGKTGSGKSTIAKLCCGIFQPTAGCIELNGFNILDYSADRISRTVAYVSQHGSLFAGTLYQNLTANSKIIKDNDLEHVLSLCCLTDLIKDRGIYSMVKEGARNFSGGEIQRLNIASALLQNTPILVLDEATSALDSETQGKVISNLRLLDKTIIFVAHRLSTIQHCNQVFECIDGNLHICSR